VRLIVGSCHQTFPDVGLTVGSRHRTVPGVVRLIVVFSPFDPVN
jgi:hypothetical protein